MKKVLQNLNWKKIMIWGLILAGANIVLLAFNTFIYRKFNPACFDKIAEATKASQMMTTKIGEYEGPSSSEIDLDNYNEGQAADFKLTITGDSGAVTFSGKLIKQGDDCTIMGIDTAYRRYNY